MRLFAGQWSVYFLERERAARHAVVVHLAGRYESIELVVWVDKFYFGIIPKPKPHFRHYIHV